MFNKENYKNLLSYVDILNRLYTGSQVLYNALKYSGVFSLDYIEDKITIISTSITKRLPSGDLRDAADSFLEMEKDGGLELSLQNMTKEAIERCSHTTGENIDSAELLVNCAINSPKGGISKKFAAFKKCADIDDIFEVVDTIHDTIILTKCISEDVRESTSEVKSSIKEHIPGYNLRDVAQFINELSKDLALKQALQKGIKDELEKCSDIIGDDVNEGEEMLYCALDVPKGGMSKKANFFIECAKINPFNAIDALQDTMLLAGCIKDNIENSIEDFKEEL